MTKSTVRRSIPQQYTAYILLILVMCLYGSLYVANKYVVNALDAPLILLFRYMVAAVVLFPLTLRQSKRSSTHRHITFRDGLGICVIGILGYAGGVGAQLLGTKYAGAATASVINAMNPIAITLMAAVLLHERLVWYRIVAICLAVVGAVTIIGGVGSAELAGICWSVLAVVLWSLMSVLLRHYTKRYAALTVTTLCMTAATLALLPIVLITHRGSYPELYWKQFLVLLYIAVACTAVAHSLWNYCLSRLDASLCSMFYPVQPLVSTILAVLILHEKITVSLVLGGLLIIFGLFMALWMERKSTQVIGNPKK